tara:strand:- start:159 stop:617 length:459 start_codon:yes stop_codon:yes gene_type:complete
MNKATAQAQCISVIIYYTNLNTKLKNLLNIVSMRSDVELTEKIRNIDSATRNFIISTKLNDLCKLNLSKEFLANKDVLCKHASEVINISQELMNKLIDFWIYTNALFNSPSNQHRNKKEKQESSNLLKSIIIRMSEYTTNMEDQFQKDCGDK